MIKACLSQSATLILYADWSYLTTLAEGDVWGNRTMRGTYLSHFWLLQTSDGVSSVCLFKVFPQLRYNHGLSMRRNDEQIHIIN
jgi:hypothetical protein